MDENPCAIAVLVETDPAGENRLAVHVEDSVDGCRKYVPNLLQAFALESRRLARALVDDLHGMPVEAGQKLMRLRVRAIVGRTLRSAR